VGVSEPVRMEPSVRRDLCQASIGVLVSMAPCFAQAISNEARHSTTRPGDALDLPTLVERCKTSVVTLTVNGSRDERVGQGTGFFVSPGRLVTNRHVVGSPNRAEIRLAGGQIVPIDALVADDEERDLVLLSATVSEVGAPALDIRPTIPRVGERIVVIGSPLGLEHTVSEGIVSSVREVPRIGEAI